MTKKRIPYRWQSKAKALEEKKQQRIQIMKNKYLANPAQVTSSKQGTRNIHLLCCTCTCEEIVPIVLQSFQLLLYQCRNGRSVLHFLVLRKANGAIIKSILSQLKKEQVEQVINMQCNYGVTPVMYAAKRGDLEMVKLLHKFGANLNHVAKDKSSLYHAASKSIDIIKYISQNNCDKQLALLPAKSTSFLPACAYSAMQSAEVLAYMMNILQLPFDDSASARARWWKLNLHPVDSKALQFLVDAKITPSLLCFKTLITRHAVYAKKFLENAPNFELDASFLYCYYSPIFALICDRVKGRLPESSWKYNCQYMPLPGIKELIQHSAPAWAIPERCNLPIRDISFRHVQMCAFDEPSLLRRLSRFQPPVNMKRLRYYNGKTWTNSFSNWDTIPYRITLVECTLFMVVPRSQNFDSISFLFE